MRRIRLTQAALVAFAALVAGLVGLATNAASAQQEPWPGPLRWVQDNPWWGMAGLLAVGIVVAVGVDVRSRGDRTEGASALTLAQVADQLAVAVGTQWQAEAQLRRLNDPHPLPVAWQPADLDLIEPWEALCISAAGWPGGPPTDPAGWATSPAELAGADNDLADRLAKIPTGRLVVLGDPGAGKTMLLIRLVLELLARRQPGDPVPILIPLAGWNPIEQDLWTWLEARLTVDYPGLAEPAPPQAGATSRARALLERRLLLPILDGLDELPEGVWSRAITRLNDALLPRQGLVLASRTAAYRQAVTPTDPAAELPVRLWGAAGVSLRPVAPKDVRAYLRRDAASPAAAARWDPVLDSLGTSAPVAQALTTPLLVGLARTIYNPRHGEHIRALPDPAQLCDTTRFPTRVAIKEHLFDAFIPAAYRPHADAARRRPWTPQQAEQWLVFLARHLEQDLQGGTDLAWWKLHEAVSRRMLALMGGLVCGLGAGLLNGLVGGLADERAKGIVDRLVLVYVLEGGLLIGLVGGLAFRRRVARTPARGLGWKQPGRRDLLTGLIVGLLFGLVIGLKAGLKTGLVAGLVVVPAIALEQAAFGMGADLTVTAEPHAALIRDRSTYWSLGVVYGLLGGLAGGLLGAVLGGLTPALVFGLLFSLALGLWYANTETAWGRFVLARYWLALRRRLPWRLMGFLADAHKQRGVLRQAGAVYQFRHVDLQRRLATRPAA
jgi:hypothetical protein